MWNQLSISVLILLEDGDRTPKEIATLLDKPLATIEPLLENHRKGGGRVRMRGKGPERAYSLTKKGRARLEWHRSQSGA